MTLAVVAVAGVLLMVAGIGGDGPRGRNPMGDLNLDGVADVGDVEPFAHAVVAPEWWMSEYHRSWNDLLALADFNRDRRLTAADRAGFVEAIRQQGRRAPGFVGTLRDPNGAVDLDIDSDNTREANAPYPERTAAEDEREADPNYPGKLVPLNYDDDNGDGLPDYEGDQGDPNHVPYGEDDYVPVAIEITPRVNVVPCEDTLAFEIAYDYTRLTVRSDVYYAIQRSGNQQRVWVHGDMNKDGALDFDDLDGFIWALTDFQAWDQWIVDPLDPNEPGYPDMSGRTRDIGDFDHDRQITFDDIDPFVAALDEAGQGILHYVPVYMWVEGIRPSPRTAGTLLTVQADTDGDALYDIQDDVLVTVWRAPLGSPAPWGRGVAVSPFSVANLDGGNILTTISLVSWDPLGPPMHFTLYHNSLKDAASPDNGGWGFFLGRGWSVSYGGRVLGLANAPSNPWVLVQDEDGTEDWYWYDSQTGEYEPPPGVHDRLQWHGAEYEWWLTREDQSTEIYSSSGPLVAVVDSSGNTLTVGREANGRITYVASAADTAQTPNRLYFFYDGPHPTGRLTDIVDSIGRNWQFEYNWQVDPNDPQPYGTLRTIRYPYDEWVDPSYLEIRYRMDTHWGQIRSIRHRDGQTWTYGYTDGRLAWVTDPGPAGAPYSQWFAYTPTATTDLWTTTYTDRRGGAWEYRFDGFGDLREATNPLSDTKSTIYDADHNPISTTDELGHTWSYTYGPVGNLLTVTSPLGQVWHRTWQQPDPANRPNFYRLTEVRDPGDDSNDPNAFVVRYTYQNPLDPTLVTGITEPPDGQGNAAATTTQEYYGPNDPSGSPGQLKRVLDMNGVEHLSRYDTRGFAKLMREGLPESGTRAVSAPVSSGAGSDGAGQETGTYGNGHCSNTSYDANGNPHPDSARIACIECAPGRNQPCPDSCPDGAGGDPGTDPVGNTPNSPRTGGTGSGDPTYNTIGFPTQVNGTVGTGDLPADRTSRSRDRTIEYHDPNDPNSPYAPQGLPLRVTISSDEAGGTIPFLRVWDYSYDEEGRILDVVGPDGGPGQQYTYDDVGRLQSVVRGGLGATYEYDAAGRLRFIRHTDGVNVKSIVERSYDDANRLLWIKHSGPGGSPLYQMIQYVWNGDNTLAQRVEDDNTVNPAQTTVVDFSYDARKRLIQETRTRTAPAPAALIYDMHYTYDQLGNRLEKLATLGQQPARRTVYTYDTQLDPNDPNSFGYGGGLVTRNNRLLRYAESAWNGQNWQLARTVKYRYYGTGHVANISIKDEYPGVGDPNEYVWWRDLALLYRSNGQLWLAMWGHWRNSQPTSYWTDDAWEFRYDGGRERYLARHWTPPGGQNQGGQWSQWVPDATSLWTDYLGEQPWQDFAVTREPNDPNGPVVTEQTRYLAGLGVHAQTEAAPADPNDPATFYLHGDLIRSTMLLTDETGTPCGTGFQPVVSYTAFGEPVWTDAAGQTVYVGTPLPAGFPTRYQYAGGWGYESGLLTLAGANPDLSPITLQHVGWRWYDPALGRFVQRDPIGLEGGLNPYAYVDLEPLTDADPDGLTKGGKQNITPSDLPPGFHDWPKSKQVDWLKAARKAAKNIRHKNALKAFLKVVKRGSGLGGFVAMWCVEKAVDATIEVIEWRPDVRNDGPPRAGEWRKYLDGDN